MANLDPQTGQPLTSPVPPEAPPAGIGAGGFPADRGSGEGSGEEAPAIDAADDRPEDGGPSSDLTREVSEPVTRKDAGTLLKDVEEDGGQP